MEADLAPIAGHHPRVADGDVAAIIVACNSGALLHDCVRRVLASDMPVDVLVVDNASTDGSTDDLPAQARLLRNARNLGFAAACNRGAAATQAPLLLFLNPDALVAAETLSRLIERLKRHPQVGLLGASIVGTDGQEQRGLRRRDPTPWRSLMSLTGLARLERRFPRLQGIEAPRTHMPEFLEYYDAVSGALMMLPRAVFDAVGGFDQGYFLHCEDLDLCRRVREAGWRVAVAADVEVTHVGGTSSRRRPLFVAWHKHRGMLRYFRRFEARRMPFGTRWIVPAAVWLKFVVSMPAMALQMLVGGRR